MNNPTLGEFCFTMIGRADIEGSKSNVAMNAWLPQASYPCGNFSDTSCYKSYNRFTNTKGSIGPAFTALNHTEIQGQANICPFALREVSVHTELALGHLRYHFAGVPPQSNSPPNSVPSQARLISTETNFNVTRTSQRMSSQCYNLARFRKSST